MFNLAALELQIYYTSVPIGPPLDLDVFGMKSLLGSTICLPHVIVLGLLWWWTWSSVQVLLVSIWSMSLHGPMQSGKLASFHEY